MGLYEAFADQRAEAAVLRQAMFGRWRTSAAVRNHTVRLLACEDTSVANLSREFSMTLAWALRAAVPRSLDLPAWRRFGEVNSRTGQPHGVASARRLESAQR